MMKRHADLFKLESVGLSVLSTKEESLTYYSFYEEFVCLVLGASTALLFLSTRTPEKHTKNDSDRCYLND